MPMIVYSHPDGGHYVVIEENHHWLKHPDTGEWVHGVMYRGVERGPTGKWQYQGAKTFSTVKSRWKERFTPIEMSNGQPLPERQ